MDEWKKKRTIMQRYDTTAGIYDRRYAEEQETKIEAAMRHLEMEKKSMILDAGCGTGLLFSQVAEKARIVIGLDVSKKSLLVARERVRALSNVDLVQADADNMPFGGRVFSHVFAFTLIQNTPNPAETLRELERVASEDAVFIVTGLKRIFTKEGFLAVLHDAGVRIIAWEDGDNLKCYVAVCAAFRH